MVVNILLIIIIMILLPGLLGKCVFNQLKPKGEDHFIVFFTEVFLLSMISYIGVSFVTLIFSFFDIDYSWYSNFIKNLVPKNFQKLTENIEFDNTIFNINWIEIISATFLSVFIGYIYAFIYNKKIINKLGRIFKCTNSIGDSDIWEYIHNSDEIVWVFFKDFKQMVTYYGYIANYSDSGKPREVTLRNVSAYDWESNHLYDLDAIYLSRNQNEFQIEIPLLASSVPQSVMKDFADENILNRMNSKETRAFHKVYREKNDLYIRNDKSSYKTRMVIQKYFILAIGGTNE